MSISSYNLPAKVSEVMATQYADTQNNRFRGFLYTQSLRNLLDMVDQDDIIEIEASRKTTNGNRDVLNVTGNGQSFIRVRDERKTDVTLHYDRTKHGRFNTEWMLDLLDEEDDLPYDLPVRRFVHRFEHDDLYDHFLRLGERVIGEEPWWVRQPFYAVLESSNPGSQSVYDRVRRHHGEKYFTRQDGGLGWKVRTLDLVEVWSHNAWCNPDDVALGSGRGRDKEEYTAREVERELFNYEPGPEDRKFGPISSPLVVNRWRSAFGASRADLKAYIWEDSAGWLEASDLN